MDHQDRKEVRSLQKQLQEIENDRKKQLGNLKFVTSENEFADLNEPELAQALNKRFDDMAFPLQVRRAEILRRCSTTETKIRENTVVDLENQEKSDDDSADGDWNDDGIGVDNTRSMTGSETRKVMVAKKKYFLDDEASCSKEDEILMVNPLRKRRRINSLSDDDEEEEEEEEENDISAFAVDEDDGDDRGQEEIAAVPTQQKEQEQHEVKDSDNDDFDLDFYNEAKEEISKIRNSQLAIAIQGFRCQAKVQTDEWDDNEYDDLSSSEKSPSTAMHYDPESITYNDRTFYRGRCYKVQNKQNRATVQVGLIRFLQTKAGVPLASCALIVPWEDTDLGMEDDDVAYVSDYKPTSHVQVHNHVADIPVNRLSEQDAVAYIPSLIYEPRTPGTPEDMRWLKFGYFYDKSNIKRRQRRKDIRLLDAFVGAGGMHLGYKAAGFKTAVAVDNNKSAIMTIKAYHKDLPVFEGDIKECIQLLGTPTGFKIFGRIDHVHVSSPCPGFSAANRFGGSNDFANNELAMCIVDLVRVTKCTTAVFENVMGMFHRKHFHYVKNIFKEILKLGYQARCQPLKACDYGDPQTRPRLIMLISHKSAPPIPTPPKTHGDGPGLIPFVTVKDALSTIQRCDMPMSNLDGKTTTLQPGQHGVVRLDPNGLAPTIRASNVPPLHPEKDRCINVREAACLQGFPVDYVFHGDLTSQYRQVGNAIPFGLARAIAQTVFPIAEYEYEKEEEEGEGEDEP